jgi:hypothetical protein
MMHAQQAEEFLYRIQSLIRITPVHNFIDHVIAINVIKPVLCNKSVHVEVDTDYWTVLLNYLDGVQEGSS